MLGSVITKVKNVTVPNDFNSNDLPNPFTNRDTWT